MSGTLDQRIEAARSVFTLTGDAHLGRCATEGCGGQPAYRYEAGGIGSDYCSGCLRMMLPDPVALFTDLAAERERLLAICRDVPGALNAAFAAGAEECEGGSVRRQEKALVTVEAMRKRIRDILHNRAASQ